VVNTNREIEECNPYFTELFGYALEDIKGKTTDIIYANKQQFYEVGKQLKDNYGGEGFSEAILYKRKDGSTFYGDTNIFYHYDQDKKIIGFVGLIRDITQRLETETSLRENERKLDQMLQHLVDGFVMVDMEGQIMYANRAAENILDLEKDVILGRYYNATEWNHVRLDGSPMEPGELPVALTLEKNQVVTNFEHGIVSMEGETIWLSVNSAPLRDKDGKIYGAIASFRDISAGKLQEEELKREAAINKALARVGQELLLPDLSVEKISNIVLEVARDLFESPHGLVGSIDEETGDIICHSFTHMLDGKEQGTLRFKRGQDGYKNLWGKALKERKAICYNSLDELSVEEIPPDHSKMHSFISAPAIFNGELVGLVSLANAPRHYNQDDLYTLQRLADLYALALFRTKTEGEILDSKNRAEESDKLKSAFLANMSHEIRTPMNGILGFGQLLRKPGLPGEKREHFVNIINANGKHLLDLINDIIDISKIEANQLEINVVKCDVNQVIEELKLTFESSLGQLGKENLLLETRAKIPGKAWVYTDITRLKQVFTNLLSNAIKFTNEGHVRLGYDFKDTDTILFFVEDTGIGISPEKQKLVFERFRQADESTTRDFGGTGLGLSICQGLVRLFGGDIWVESEKDKGSVFYFTHPYKPATGPGQEVKISEILPEIIDWSSNKVLIVEDDPTSQIYLSECLSETGIQIVQAGDGQQAIDICFADKSIDLVLMDIQLPMKNGYEATQAIKQFRNDLPVIAQTAYAMENERDACFKAGCDGYVTKPIDIDKLVGEMMKHLVPK
jgi:PAS domain S-box-containing protein